MPGSVCRRDGTYIHYMLHVPTMEQTGVKHDIRVQAGSKSLSDSCDLCVGQR